MEANRQLEEWLSRVEGKELAGRVAKAFAGTICKGDIELLAELRRMMESAAPELRAEALRVLTMHGGMEAKHVVRTSLRDRSPVVRRQALVGIDYACDPEALSDVEQLIQLEQSEDVLAYAKSVAQRLKGDEPCVPIPGLQTNKH